VPSGADFPLCCVCDRQLLSSSADDADCVDPAIRQIELLAMLALRRAEHFIGKLKSLSCRYFKLRYPRSKKIRAATEENRTRQNKMKKSSCLNLRRKFCFPYSVLKPRESSGLLDRPETPASRSMVPSVIVDCLPYSPTHSTHAPAIHKSGFSVKTPRFFPVPRKQSSSKATYWEFAPGPNGL
jgi:hypothetical protein